MKLIKKMAATIIAAAIAFTAVSTPIYAVYGADGAIDNADKAGILKDLGLYAGTDATDVAAGLDGALTTQDSLIFLAKLFGYYEEANALTDEQVTSALAKFDDAASISDYAKRVIAYSTINGILAGSTADGKFFVGAKDTVTAARFATFMLKQMGYTVADYRESVGRLTSIEGNKHTTIVYGDLTKNDAVGMMYDALTAKKAKGNTILSDIVAGNSDLRTTALANGFTEEDMMTNVDKATTLKDLGLYAGTDATDVAAGLDEQLTTQDSLIFLAKLFGYDEAANLLTPDQVSAALAKFDDAASISNYARNAVAYSAANNILAGSTSNGRFFVGAKDTVTAARFATFMLKQMGYTVSDYKESVAKLAGTKGSKVASTLTGDLRRNDAVGVMYGALTAEKASGNTVISDIIGDNADLTEIAKKAGLLSIQSEPDIGVKSVKALNPKQIEIVFYSEMYKSSAEDESFYKILDKGEKEIELSEKSAQLGSDNKTVIITLNKNITDKLTNSSKAAVTVKKDVTAKDERTLPNDAIFNNVDVEDGILPTVTKVEAVGEKMIKITFSEPVYDGGNDNIIANSNFEINSGTYRYFIQKATLDNDVIYLTVGTKLIEGPISVMVNAAGFSGRNHIIDYSGYAVFKGISTFDYAKDVSVPVVTVKEATQKAVTLAFSKPVKFTDLKLYHSVKGVRSFLSSDNTAFDYVYEWTFEFNKYKEIPLGTITFYLVNDNMDSKKMTDAYGIKVPDQKLTCDVLKTTWEEEPVQDDPDEDDPSQPVDIAVEAVRPLNTKQIEIEFNQEMDKEFAENEMFYEISDEEKNVMQLDYMSALLGDDGKTVTITFNLNVIDKLTNNSTAKVTVKKGIKAKDETELLQDIVIDDVSVQDNIIPTVKNIIATGEKNIKVIFSEPVYDGDNDLKIANANFEVKSGTYTYYVQEATLDGDAINLSVGTKLIEGPVTVTVNANGISGSDHIIDYAGHAVLTCDTIVNYVKDTSVSVVTVKEASQWMVTLAFSKPVKFTDLKLYHTANGSESYLSGYNTTYGYVTEWTFEFGEKNRLPAGTTNLYLVNDAQAGNKMMDGYGITVPDQTLTCEVKPDTEENQPGEDKPVDDTPPALSLYIFNTGMIK